MFRDRADEAGTLLDLLGNVTRRRILEILANEPKYFIQLSRELGVSQQAVLKHLSLLVEFGLVSSFRAKSDLAAPDRKYYRLRGSLSLSVGISGDAVNIDIQSLAGSGEEALSSPSSTAGFRELLSELKAVEKAKEIATVLKKTDSLVHDLDERTKELEEEKFALLRVKQQALQKAHTMIRESLEDGLGRRILYSMLGSSERPDIEVLSEELNIREKEIKETIEELERRFSIQLLWM